MKPFRDPLLVTRTARVPARAGSSYDICISWPARRVATGGAALQVDFRADGKELFILAADGDRTSLFTSELRLDGKLEISRPQKLFTLPAEWTGFAPAPKGDRFLLLEPVGSRSPSLTLVDNWRAQLAP